MACGDVEKDEFVGSLRVVNLRALHRITRVTKLEEFRAFDDTAFLDVETGNDAFGEHEEDWMAERNERSKKSEDSVSASLNFFVSFG